MSPYNKPQTEFFFSLLYAQTENAFSKKINAYRKLIVLLICKNTTIDGCKALNENVITSLKSCLFTFQVGSEPVVQ